MPSNAGSLNPHRRTVADVTLRRTSIQCGKLESTRELPPQYTKDRKAFGQLDRPPLLAEPIVMRMTIVESSERGEELTAEWICAEAVIHWKIVVSDPQTI